MPIEQTDWNGVLFSEAGSRWRLFGSAELIRISRAHCASPSSALFFLFSLYLYQISLSLLLFNGPVFLVFRQLLLQPSNLSLLPKAPSSKHGPRRSVEAELKFVYQVVCVYACVMGDVQKLIAGGEMSLPTSSLWLPPSRCPMWCSGSKTNLRCLPNHKAKSSF